MPKTLFLVMLAAALTAASWITPLAASGTERSASPGGASVGFANLEDGDVVPPGYTVRFTISGMGIAPAGVEIENTGHFHLLIDLETLPEMDAVLPATANILHFGKGQAETRLDLPEGPHTLRVLLADHRHVPHEPPVISDPVRITISADAPVADDSAN